MKRNILKNLLSAALLLVMLASCHENKFGVVDLTPDTAGGDDTDYVGDGLQHPCMLLTNADFDYIKGQRAKGESNIQKTTFNWMTRSGNEFVKTTYSPSPVKYLARLDATNWGKWNERWVETGFNKDDFYEGIHANYMNFSRDCAAALAQAILWKITGETAYAATSIKILNAWVSTCKGYVTNKAGEFIDPNENLIALEIYQIANAAELMRDYDGWSSADFDKFKTWMVEVFYPHNTSFIAHKGEACPVHSWFNWDLANMTAILAIGILTDDNAKINEALNYYKYLGSGSGFYLNGIPFVHSDPDSSEMLGQCQESGRDQGHTALCVGMLAIFCKMAANVGEDLLAYDNYRALSMFEYYAKYNVGESEAPGTDNKGWVMQGFKYAASQVPYETLEKCTNTNTNAKWPELSYEEKQNGNDTRGAVNPSWELVCRMAEDAGQSAIYSTLFRDAMRQNASRGNCDGGAGDYGPDSGGFDIFGWGSLLYAK
ncbi:alginate lyase family protein [Bacteroides difficilis]|uniref:alginate lyase family protein n=1 Tax=Bacteroides difficilis TaxID=2763021 RepID=UPI003AAF2AA1